MKVLTLSFVFLQASEIKALIAGETESTPAKNVIARLKLVMRNFSYNRFVSVDLAAPTYTPRFQEKR
ncbi:MAG: hypothetical protein II744_04145, partial [Eubacterium sp.]|nr:hypothetical protein [Eubacterium sp.]